MIDIKDRVCEAVAGKIMSAEAAAEFVKDGDNVGTSGFTPSGYPKAVPLALAEKGNGYRNDSSWYRCSSYALPN